MKSPMMAFRGWGWGSSPRIEQGGGGLGSDLDTSVQQRHSGYLNRYAFTPWTGPLQGCRRGESGF